MKQKHKVLPNIGVNSSTLPSYIRLNVYRGRYAEEAGLLELKDGAIPFFVRFFPLNNTNVGSFKETFETLRSRLLVDKRRVSKDYLEETFWIYTIADYGHQSLSPGFEDFVALCFDQNGYKIPQSSIAFIKNYTTKETYILLEKSAYTGSTGPLLNILIEEKNYVNTEVNYIPVQKVGNEFKLNLLENNYQIDSIDEIEVYVKEGQNYYRLDNSDYFLSLDRETDFPEGDNPVLVSEQQTEFKSRLQGTTYNKGNFNNNIIISPNLKSITTIYIKTKDHRTTFYNNTYGNFLNVKLESTDELNLFKSTSQGLKRLIPGIEFYIDANKVLTVPNTLTSDFLELFVISSNKKMISLPFNIESDNSSFDVNATLYHNNMRNWNLNKVQSTIFIFKDGLMYNVGDKSTGYPVGTYDYIISGPIFDTNSSTAPTGTPTTLLLSQRTFDNFNKYQISTDPGFNTYGETSVSDFSTQEVYLYDENLNFKIESLEPSIIENNGKYSIQSVSDLYPDFLGTTTESNAAKIIGNYIDFQEEYLNGKIKLTDMLHNSTIVQTIENNIIQLKKNYMAFLKNSNLTYVAYSAQLTNQEFIFLVLEGVSGKTFNIIYRDNLNNIIKKEYNCTLAESSWGPSLYVSVPFFLDRFSGSGINSVSITVEPVVPGDQVNYYLFR